MTTKWIVIVALAVSGCFVEQAPSDIAADAGIERAELADNNCVLQREERSRGSSTPIGEHVFVVCGTATND